MQGEGLPVGVSTMTPLVDQVIEARDLARSLRRTSRTSKVLVRGLRSGGRLPSTYYVAWWNVENLFDEENSPRRTEKLQRAIGGDLAGWTPARRDRKIAQLASVIAQMNSGSGPDLLGVCEVENRFVLDLLVGRAEHAAAGSQLRGRPRRHRRRPRHRRGVHLRRRPLRRAGRRGVLPRRDAPQRHPRDRPGQLQDEAEPNLVGVRESLAVTQRRPVRVGRLPAHRRRDPRLLPPAGARGARPGDTRARDGRLQRRAVRHLAGDPCAEHPPAPAGGGRRHTEVLEPGLAR